MKKLIIMLTVILFSQNLAFAQNAEIKKSAKSGICYSSASKSYKKLNIDLLWQQLKPIKANIAFVEQLNKNKHIMGLKGKFSLDKENNIIYNKKELPIFYNPPYASRSHYNYFYKELSLSGRWQENDWILLEFILMELKKNPEVYFFEFFV